MENPTIEDISKRLTDQEEYQVRLMVDRPVVNRGVWFGVDLSDGEVIDYVVYLERKESERQKIWREMMNCFYPSGMCRCQLIRGSV